MEGGRERQEVREGVLSQAVTTMGNWISYHQGALGYSVDYALQLPIQEGKELGHLYNNSL